MKTKLLNNRILTVILPAAVLYSVGIMAVLAFIDGSNLSMAAKFALVFAPPVLFTTWLTTAQIRHYRE